MFRVRGSKATLALYGGVSTASMGLAHTHSNARIWSFGSALRMVQLGKLMSYFKRKLLCDWL